MGSSPSKPHQTEGDEGTEGTVALLPPKGSVADVCNVLRKNAVVVMSILDDL